jgi:hypothetical protein
MIVRIFPLMELNGYSRRIPHFIRNDYWGMGYGEIALHFRIKPHFVVIPSKARNL